MKKLKNVQKYLNDIPYINKGGCGIVAISLHRWLRKNLESRNDKFVFLYNNKGNYLNNQSVLRDNFGEPTAPAHCAILHKGNFLDSTKELNVSDYGWIQIIDEEKFILETLENVSSWNSAFDRGWINKIEKKLNINLEVLKGLNELE